jgi:nitroimidazol reductase NimA-like FMN-containing flavoprotein (pyridoxamine 5'-phosphate oxidase superfamily)
LFDNASVQQSPRFLNLQEGRDKRFSFEFRYGLCWAHRFSCDTTQPGSLGRRQEVLVRRSDKEITDRSHIDRIIRGSQVCHLAFALNDQPYVVPLSFGYDGEAFYFHTARRGKKIDFIAANPRVCFECVRDVRLVTSPDDPCGWSFSYESVVGYGTISELTSHEHKANALSQIVLQCSRREWDFASTNLDSVRVWRLPVESVTGKRSPQKEP